jgi:hypothetical protein
VRKHETPGRLKATRAQARRLTRRVRQARTKRERERAREQLAVLVAILGGSGIHVENAPQQNLILRLQALYRHLGLVGNELIDAIVGALGAAKIKYPCPDTNRSKFVALMRAPAPPREKSYEADDEAFWWEGDTDELSEVDAWIADRSRFGFDQWLRRNKGKSRVVPLRRRKLCPDTPI